MNNERYAGNVTKSATMGVGMVGAVMTIIVYIAARFGVELPGDVQAAISTLILGATAYIFGRNAKGEKAALADVLESLASSATAEPQPTVGAVAPTPADSMRDQWENEALGGRQYRYGEAGAPEGGAPGQVYDPRVGWVDEIADQFPSDSVAR